MPRKKRLLLLFDLAFPFVKGGAQRRLYEVGRRLAADGWEVSWMAFQSWDGPACIEHDGINYIGMGALPSLYGKHGNRTGYEPVRYGFEISRRLPELGRFDVIWAGQWPLLHLAPMLLHASFGRRRVVIDWWEVWGAETWRSYSLLGYVGHYVANFVLWWAGKVGVLVTDTALEQRRMREVAGAGAQIECIPNGIPKEEISLAEDPASRELDVVSLGRLKNHKRVDVLIDALRILRAEHGFMPSVAIVGDGPERADLEAMASAAGLSNVTFHGFVADFKDVYTIAKSAKLCVVSTMKGGGGNLTLMEAYGCGLPVLAFRCEEGIDPELVVEGKTGLLLSPPTSRELAVNLLSLLREPARIESMRREVQAYAAEHDWNNVARSYEAIFSKLAP